MSLAFFRDTRYSTTFLETTWGYSHVGGQAETQRLIVANESATYKKGVYKTF